MNFVDEVNHALQRIARGTGIVFAGTVISMFFGFLSRAIIARYFSTGEYGVFNLALTVLSIALLVATLGFQSALPREVAFYREKEPSKLEKLISTAMTIVALNSLIIMVFMILASSAIAQVFNEARLDYALKIMALALPFSALVGVTISITQGFGRVRERVYFQNIIYPILWLILILFLYVFALPFSSLFSAYVLAQGVTCILLFLEVFRIRIFELKFSFDLKIGKELIRFSVLLMFTGILWFFMSWTDTLMLGYYKTSEFVGLYNAASSLARLIPIFLTSAGVIYTPIVSQLYAQEKIKEMGRVYQLLTKWVFLLTLPIFAVMFLFPEAIIGFFFGSKYVPASSALQILALGFMFHTILGLNGESLITIKDSKFVFFSNGISAISNVLLNILFVPVYGIDGAAIATAVSYFISNALKSLRLYQKTSIHPFTRNYVKSLVISFGLLALIQSLHLKVPRIWHAVPVLVVFLGVYFILVLLSKSVDKEDVELFLIIEKKLGFNLGIIKKILMRFV